jgi:hypothetical protein
MLREVRRSAAALAVGAAPVREAIDSPITTVRAVAQIALTVVLLPLTVWVVFGPQTHAPAARDAASALLGAIVTFWLKD